MRKLRNLTGHWLRNAKAWMLAGALGLATPVLAQPEIQFAVTNLSVFEGNTLAVILTCQPATTGQVRYTITQIDPGGLAHLVGPVAGVVNFTNNSVAFLNLNTTVNTNIEGTLRLLVSLSNPTNAVLGAQSNAVVSIMDRDTVFRYDTDIYRTSEDETEVVITVFRQGNTNGPATVDFQTVEGTALDTQDYLGHPVGITLFFADGQSSNVIRIPIVDDCVIETNVPGKYFTNVLSNPVVGFGTARIIQTNSLVLIADNDSASGQVAFIYDPFINPMTPQREPYAGGEPPHIVNIWVARPCGQGDIAVDYQVSTTGTCPGETNAFHNINDDADPLNDFRLVSPLALTGPNSLVGTLTWGANDHNPKAVQIEIIDDYLVELNESMTITLFNPRGINGNTARPQIRNTAQDFVLTIAFDDQPAGAGVRTYNTANLFVQDPGANNNVYAVVLHGAGAIIGGDFTGVNTVPLNRIARITGNGTVDTAFQVGEGFDGSVLVIATYPTNSVHSGKIVVGGSFTSYQNQPRNGIVRLNQNGSLDTTFRPGNGVQMEDGFTPAVVRTIAVLDDNKVLIGGEFDTVNSTQRRNIARLNEDGSLDGNFDPGLGANGAIWALAVQKASPITLTQSGFGPFESRTNINTAATVGTLSLDYNFYTDTNTIRVYYNAALLYDSGATATTSGPVHVDLAYGPGPSTFVTIVVNEGSTNAALFWDYTVTIVGGGSASRVIVGGDFTTFGGAARARLARLSSNGTLDNLFDTMAGADERIYSILVQPDNRIVLGGNFTTLGVASRAGLARLLENGSLDATFNPGTGLNGPIYAMAFDTNGYVFVAGEFTSFNDTSRTNMARVFPNGTLDTSYQDNYYNWTRPGVYQYIPSLDLTIPGNIRSLAVQPDGNILVGGRFDLIGGGYSPDEVQTRHNYMLLVGGPNPQVTNYPDRPNQGPPPHNNPGNIEFVRALYTVDENVGSGQVNLTLQRINGVLGTITSLVYTVNGSAVAGRDYQSVTQAVVWNTCVGGTRVISVPITDNQIMEANRDFNLVVVTPKGIGVDATNSPALGFQSVTKVTIVDNDFENGVLGFSAPYYYVAEDGSNAVVTVTRTNGLNGSVSVQYFAVDGTATRPSDYTFASGTLSFAAGATSQTFKVPIINDTSLESEESVLLYLATPQGGATLGLAAATLVIRDNDPGTTGRGSMVFSSHEYSVAEDAGTALIPVFRTGGANNTQSVTVVVREIPGLTNGAALAGVDFAATTNLLIFGVGEVSKTIAVPILNDTIVDGPERFQVTLYTNAGAYGQLGVVTNAIVIILDDDSYGTLSYLQPRFAVNEQEASALITVVRRDGSSGIVSVNYATAPAVGPDAAIETVNYLGTSGTLTWQAGEVGAKTFQVPILYNPALEGNRIVNLTLSNPAKAVLGPVPAATLMIVDAESQNVPAGSVDTTFNASPGIDNFVQSIAVQNDGALLVGGDFRSVNGVLRSRIARLHVNGALDVTFNPLGGFNDTVYAMAVQSDGKVLVGGRFTMFDVTNRNGLARLNVDGKLDSFFNPGSGADNPVYAVAVHRDGRIAIGGSFTTFKGIYRPNLAVLNTNGSVMTSFAPGAGPNGVIYGVVYQPDGKLLVGGSFTKYNGQSRNNLARINPDGTLDATFQVGLGPNDSVRALALQENGKIVIGGLFTSVSGVARGRLARLEADGSLDAGFLANDIGADGVVIAVSVQSDGKVVAAGDFNRFNGVSRSRLTRLNADGTTDPAINFGTGANGHIAAVANQSDDQIVIGGGFTTFNGIERSYFARLIGYQNVGAGKFEFLAPVFYQNENVTNALVTVRRNWGTSNEVRVAYSAAGGGTAAPGVDFVPVSGFLTFPQGETLQSFSVPIINDAEVEPPENVLLSLNNPTNLTLGGSGELDFQKVADLTILSDDNVIGFSSPTYDVNENTISGFAVVNVIRSGSTNGFASVDIAIIEATATAGLDYSNVVTTLTFAPGETNKPYFVPIYDDSLVEGDEVALILLSNPSIGTVLGQASGTLTIKDNDTAAGELNFASAVFAVNEFETNMVITVLRTNGSSGFVQVSYETTDGTAQAGLDYVAKSDSLAFVEGETVKTFNVPIKQDFLTETNETVFLRLFNARGTAGVRIGNVGQATLIIVNSVLTNGNLVFSAPVYAASETNASVSISVQRLYGAAGNITVQYATGTNGTARPGINYQPAAGTLSWAGGDLSPKTFSVAILSNNVVEGDLAFPVSIFAPTGGATLGAMTNATVNVKDSSVGPGNLTFGAVAYQISEVGTNAHITVLRTNGALGTVSVDFSTSDGTGVAGVNYSAVNRTMVFTNGQATATVLVPVFERPGADLNKTVNLRLANPTTAGLGTITTALLTIVESQMVAGSVNLTFNPDLNGSVDAIYVRTNSDNKILIAGGFTQVEGNFRTNLARLNPNGSLDLVFDVGQGPNGAVRTIAGLPDGRSYVAGAFTSFSGLIRNYIARLLADGSVDGTFVAVPDNLVNIIALQQDEKVLIGGLFTAVAGVPRGYLARLNPDGTLDTNFLASAVGADGVVRCIAVQTDGKILIGGDFNYVNGVARPKIARLNPDGSVDSAFNPGTGPDASVRALVIQPDDRILLGGLFESVAGVSRSYVARLEPDGSLDQSFNPGAGADEFVSSIAVQPDGKVIIGGAFTTFNGYRRNRITRLNGDGAVDTTFNIGIGANNYVAAVVVQPDLKVLVGGGFTSFNGLPRKYLTRLNGGYNLGPGAFEYAVTNFNATENSSNAVVTVVRTIGTAGEVYVNYSTSNGSAVAGVDYQPVSGTLRFADGETVQSFVIPISDNAVPTSNRVVNLLLASPQGGAELGAGAASTLTIVEDDGIIGFDQVNFSANEGSGIGVVTVTRLAGSIGGASVDYVVSDGTAINGSDYLSAFGTLIFTNGQTNAYIFVPILDDALIEGDETISLTLLNLTNAVLGRASATLTIVDNESGPGELGFSVADFSVTEDGGSVNITVKRTGGSSGGVSVEYAAVAGTAVAGADFVTTNGVLQFPDGVLTRTLTVHVLDDALSEGNETVFLTLSNPQGGATINSNTANAVLTILDNDVLPGAFRFLSTNFVTTEDAFLAVVTVVRTNGSTGDVSVDFLATSGTAVAGLDFVGMTNTLAFTNGEVRKEVVITIFDDVAVEPTETVNLRLLNPRNGATLAEPSTATLAIFDNESFVTYGAANYSINEDAGSALVTVVRTGGTGSVVSVSYATGGGTAQAGSDYTPASGTLTFLAGETLKNFVVPITDNSITNLNKTVNLTLFGPLGGALVGSPSNAVLTIVDNDSLVSLSAAAYEVSESAGSVAVTVTRSGSIGVPGSVNVAVGGGTAMPGVHYAATNLTLFFSANEAQKTVVIPVYPNAIKDGNRTVNLTLSLPSRGLIIVRGSAVLTILDDDSSIVVPVAAALVAEGQVNGSIDPGETVTMSLALRNTGNLPTANLVATLLATNGVASPSGAQTYGVLSANGVSVSRSFTFTANNTNGGVVTLVLKLDDGAASLGTVSFNFLVGRLTTTYANTNAINILDNGPAAPYPAAINVTGLHGSISKLAVTLSNITHEFPKDIGVLLAGPQGQRLVLMSYAVGGWDYALANTTIVFDDAATNSLPFEGAVVSGHSYRPTNYFNVPFPAPAPSVSASATNLAVFNGTDPNGVWSLYVIDQNTGDVGRINGGWSLSISTTENFPPMADVAATVTGSPASLTAGQNLTYIVGVTNGGPVLATAVTLTNRLPAGVTVVSATASSGSALVTGNLVTANFGNLAVGAGATLTLVVNTPNAGALTNLATVASAVADPAAANNTALLVQAVNPVTPPSFANAAMGPGGFQLTVTGVPGSVFYLDVSTNLVNWLRVSTNVLTGASTTITDPTVGATPLRYYRIMLP